LKQYTAARVALGRTGNAIALRETLDFRLAHAHARDAVFDELDLLSLVSALKTFHLPIHLLQSRAATREEYLQRPDLGRMLVEKDAQTLRSTASDTADISIILGDGLSATAINKHALPVLKILIPALTKERLRLAPLTLVQQARVAIGDEICSLLQARVSLILIGERPGLSAPDSLGAYLTYDPAPGLTDERRNCISNIRSGGLSYELAAEKIMYLTRESRKLGISGLALKDHDPMTGVASAPEKLPDMNSK
jgi:ethanolamine ammonia-lyase small subunit